MLDLSWEEAMEGKTRRDRFGENTNMGEGCTLKWNTMVTCFCNYFKQKSLV